MACQLHSQTIDQYSFKIQGIYGNFLYDSRIKDLTANPISGAELSVEFQTTNKKPWYQHNGFPILGIGGVWLNLGNPAKLGDAFAIYPYICYPIIRTNFLKLNLKGGAGASYLTKTYYSTNTYLDNGTIKYYPSLDNTNRAIGSRINVYFSGGLNLEIPITYGFSLTGDYTWNHMSNGSAIAPNYGLNMFNGFAGLKYTPNYKNLKIPEKENIPDVPRKFSVEFIASGGLRQLYYQDNYIDDTPNGSPQFRFFPIASFIVGVYHPITNFYRMGLAVDAFYDGAYDGHEILFKRVYLKTNELKNKIRIGTSWQNELLLGKLTAGIDLGLYLYDPIKNLSPYIDALSGPINKPLIYKYDINTQDGWFYSRFKLKYALDKHYFLSLGLKTHQQKAEFIEWGIGYKL